MTICCAVPSRRPTDKLLAGSAALCLASAASATILTVTTDISQSQSYPGGTGFNVTTQTVLLPTGFTDAKINIVSIFANDAAVLQVNGVNIVGWGIFGPGTGGFAFSAAGPFEPYTYTLGHGYSPQTVNQSYSAPFVTGANLIKVFHNDNHNGIYGSSFSVAHGELQFNANLSYSLAAVPEPETWALLLAGGALVAAAAGRRAKH